MTFSFFRPANRTRHTPNKASRQGARNEQARQVPPVSKVDTPHLIFRLDMLCDLIGWHRNPFGRHIEAGFWADLERDYPELKGRVL